MECNNTSECSAEIEKKKKKETRKIIFLSGAQCLSTRWSLFRALEASRLALLLGGLKKKIVFFFFKDQHKNAKQTDKKKRKQRRGDTLVKLTRVLRVELKPKKKKGVMAKKKKKKKMN